MIWLLTALAGGAGAVARFGLGVVVERHVRRWPLGTFPVNVSACFAIGLLAGWAGGQVGNIWLTLLGVGFLGGYSTFSAASVEAVQWLREGRYITAAVHTVGLLAVSLAAYALGYLILSV